MVLAPHRGRASHAARPPLDQLPGGQEGPVPLPSSHSATCPPSSSPSLPLPPRSGSVDGVRHRFAAAMGIPKQIVDHQRVRLAPLTVMAQVIEGRLRESTSPPSFSDNRCCKSSPCSTPPARLRPPRARERCPGALPLRPLPPRRANRAGMPSPGRAKSRPPASAAAGRTTRRRSPTSSLSPSARRQRG